MSRRAGRLYPGRAGRGHDAILAIVLGTLNLIGWGIPLAFFSLGTFLSDLTHTNVTF